MRMAVACSRRNIAATVRYARRIMKLAAVVMLLVACKGGDKPADKSGDPAKPPSGGAVPTKPSVAGELVVSGALTGAFQWKDDLALTCTWIPSLKQGAIEATMTDGKNTFIAVEVHFGNENPRVVFSSGALKGAPTLVGKTGFSMTGSDDRTALTATLDVDLDSKEGVKVHLKGTLDARCPP
jgi:hypothetical protein